MKSLEELLISGGDQRLEREPLTGLNRFGCASLPRPESLNFSSSTASTISPEALCRVRSEYGHLSESAWDSDTFEARMEELRWELKSLLGLGLTEAEIVFSPSGTDSTLHALFLTRTLQEIKHQNGLLPLDAILVGSDETGTGVPRALVGRHFSTITAECVPVTLGGSISGLSDGVTLVSLPQGALCRMEDAVCEAVTHSVAAGHRVLLQVMDSSKMGTRSLSFGFLQQLQKQFLGFVTVVVDACQMRLSRARLQRHLAEGHWVLISGSKFFTGPAFSGALLVPQAVSVQVKKLTSVPPTGLRDYTNRASWPCAWTGLRDQFSAHANFGQYLRWVAALEEMRRYYTVPWSFRVKSLCHFASMTQNLLRLRAPQLMLLGDSPPPLEEWEEDSEMGARTIFPFAMQRAGRWLTFEETTALYHALISDCSANLPASACPERQRLAATPCHLGQPVRVVMPDGAKSGALRLSTSARTVSDLWARHCEKPATGLLDIFAEQMNIVLDKIGLVLTE